MRTDKLERLFDVHTADLQRLYPDLEDAYICPVCLQLFLREHLHRQPGRAQLTEGHVWPKNVRRANRDASRQSVLLCKECNSGAGGHGDQAFGNMHRMREDERSGRLCGARLVTVVGAGSREPTVIRARVEVPTPDNPRNVELTVRETLNNPEQLERWRAFADSGEPAPAVIVSPPDLPPGFGDMARVGLLTSAYLFAFYRLGYRYILQACVEPVRECIRDSFRAEEAKSVETLRQLGVTLYELDDVTDPHPTLFFVATFPDGEPPSLEVQFGRYGTRLPLPERTAALVREFARQRAAPGLGVADELLFTLSRWMSHGRDEPLWPLFEPVDLILQGRS